MAVSYHISMQSAFLPKLPKKDHLIQITNLRAQSSLILSPWSTWRPKGKQLLRSVSLLSELFNTRFQCANSDQTYTIEFNRDGSPLRAYIVGRVVDTGHRFLANDADRATLLRLSSTTEEPIGKAGFVIPEPEGEHGQKRNLFSLDSNSKL